MDLDGLSRPGLLNTYMAIRNSTIDMKRTMKKTEDLAQVAITPREQEVVHLLAKGLSSRKIAEELKISFHTVESYRKHLLQKFNSKTTVEMVLKAAHALPPEFWLPQNGMKH